MEALLNVVENAAGNCTKADDAEQHVIDELRKMGNDALHCWADTAVDKAVDENNSDRAEEKLTGLPVAGCPYADQCPDEAHSCRQALPELRELKKGHYVACFRT